MTVKPKGFPAAGTSMRYKGAVTLATGAGFAKSESGSGQYVPSLKLQMEETHIVNEVKK